MLVAACGGSATPVPTAAPGKCRGAGVRGARGVVGGGLAGTGRIGQRLPGTAPVSSPAAPPALEAMLPASVNGVTFERTSFGGAAWPAGIPIGESDLVDIPAAERQDALAT